MPLSSSEQRLADTIRASSTRLLDDLRTHVNLPTGGISAPAMDESLALFTRRLEKLGASVFTETGERPPAWLFSGASEMSPRKVAICSKKSTGASRILLSGHVDTVHEPDSAFRELTIAPGKQTATGPGCVDMKGGLVIAVAALEALEACAIPCTWSFIFSTDEETGSYAAERFLREQAKLHDVGLALEPAMADGGLVVERPGSGQFFIEATGNPAHVGRDFKSGVSAIDAIARAIPPISSLAAPDDGLIVSVGIIHGGTATNIVPDSAKAWGNMRFSRREQGEAAVRGIQSACKAAAGKATLDVQSTLNRPAKPTTDGTMALAHLARAVAEDLGQRLPFGKTGGVCEGNNLQAEGLPTIDTLGVRGGGLHTPQEWIDLSSLVERCQLLAILLSRLSERPFQEWSKQVRVD
ncbi:MAG: M20/M25/M40 family metallo-hydrolase [Phycisphaeraceae bacterium]|nr:M20/M25/M40 family metallo-hydrolase [Phycisphaeraceae bacterium]